MSVSVVTAITAFHIRVKRVGVLTRVHLCECKGRSENGRRVEYVIGSKCCCIEVKDRLRRSVVAQSTRRQSALV